MKRIITFLQEGHFIKEKPHMALAQFIFRRLAFQVKFPFGNSVGNTGKFAVFGKQMLIAQFTRRDKINSGHKSSQNQ